MENFGLGNLVRFCLTRNDPWSRLELITQLKPIFSVTNKNLKVGVHPKLLLLSEAALFLSPIAKFAFCLTTSAYL